VMNVALGTDGTLIYDVAYAGAPVIAPSPVGLILADKPGDVHAGRLTSGLRILATDRREGHDAYTPVHGKTAQVDDSYSELTIHAQEAEGKARRIDLVLRAYNAGGAFRLVLPRRIGDHVRSSPLPLVPESQPLAGSR